MSNADLTGARLNGVITEGTIGLSKRVTGKR